MTEIHIGMIQGRHKIDEVLDGYIWGEHLVDEGIMKWEEVKSFKVSNSPYSPSGLHPTGEKVLMVVDGDDTSTHRRVAGEWITENVLNHPILDGDIVANSYKLKVIFYITGGMTQLSWDFLSSWVRLTGMEIHLERATYHPETNTYTRRGWP